MSYAFGFLKKYIENNPDITLEEVLNDDDFLDELKLKDENLLSFLVKHLDKIVTFVIDEPPIQSDYKRGYKFPFIATEILSLDSPIITQEMFKENYELKFDKNLKNFNDLNKISSETEINRKYPLLILLISELSKISDLSNETALTIAGYLGKIILNTIRQGKIFIINCFTQPEYVEFLCQSLFKNIHFDEVAQILFEILKISLPDVDNTIEAGKLQIKNTKLKILLITRIFENIKSSRSTNNTNYDEKQITIEADKLKNSLQIIIKLVKFLFGIKENGQIFSEIVSKSNLEILENIIFTKSENKMSDENLDINENDAKSIMNILLFYFNLIQATLLPPVKNEVITSNLFDEEVALEVNLHGKGKLNDNTDIIEEEKVKENEKHDTDNLLEKVDKLDNFTSNLIPNFYDYLSDEVKSGLVYYFVKLFPQIFEMSNKIKLFSKGKKIHSLQNDMLITPVSQCYLIFIDLLILLISVKSGKFLELLKNSNSIFKILIDDFIFYSNNTFLMIKILKIFEIVLYDSFYVDVKLRILYVEKFETSIGEVSIFKYLANMVDFKNFINLEKKTLSYRNVYSLNFAYIIRMLNYFFVSIQGSHDNNVLNNSNALGVSNEELALFGDYLSVYLEITSKDLLSDKIQSKEDLKNAGDEEIKINLEKNFYDSEAFLFTTKKIIENSKKISQKLKELDS